MAMVNPKGRANYEPNSLGNPEALARISRYRVSVFSLPRRAG